MKSKNNFENFRLAIVICSTSFLLGTIFTHWIADHGTLWQTPTTDSLSTSLSYYRNLVNVNIYIKHSILSISVIGFLAILVGLYNSFKSPDSDWVFEAGSLFLYSTALTVYYLNALPPLLTIQQSDDYSFNKQTFNDDEQQPSLSFITPDSLFTSIPSELINAVRDIAAAHLLCAVSLTGTILFYAGSAWVEYERQLDLKKQEERECKSKKQ